METTRISEKQFALFGSMLMLCLTLAGNTCIFGQTSINSGSADTANHTGSISHTIGQTVFGTIENSTGTVHQGFPYPYEVEITKTTPEWEQAKIEVFFAYPNPASGVLTLKFTGDVLQNFSLVLYDMNGKMMVQKPLNNRETQIDMLSFKSGAYILRVTQEDKEIVVMKIIKS